MGLVGSLSETFRSVILYVKKNLIPLLAIKCGVVGPWLYCVSLSSKLFRLMSTTLTCELQNPLSVPPWYSSPALACVAVWLFIYFVSPLHKFVGKPVVLSTSLMSLAPTSAIALYAAVLRESYAF